MSNVSEATQNVFIIWATAVTDIVNFTENSLSVTETLNLTDLNESFVAFEESSLFKNISSFNSSGIVNLSSTKESLILFNRTLSNQIASKENLSEKTNGTLNAPLLLGPVEWTGSKIGIFFGCFIIMFFTISGNLLVMTSVYFEKKLQTPFNYYLVNLALTDFIVGSIAMSIYTIYTVHGFFPFNYSTCCFWSFTDSTMTFASVATLAAISIDRLWSVTWSVHYRNHNSGFKSFCIIISTWVYVLTLWLPAFTYDRIYNPDEPGICFWNSTRKSNKWVAYTAVMLYYVPLTVMLCAYARLFYVMQRRHKQIANTKQIEPSMVSHTSVSENPKDQNRNHPKSEPKQKVLKTQNDSEMARSRREKRAFYTLGHIVVGFLICWIPFYLFIMIDAYLPDYLPEWFFNYSFWMSYINSSINPIIYGIGNDDFRRAFKKVVTLKYFRKS